MAGGCPTGFDAMAANQSGHDVGNQIHGSSSTRLNLDGLRDIRNFNARQRKVIMEINDLYGTGGVGNIITPSPKDAARLRQDADYLANATRFARQAEQRRAEAQALAWNIASGASINAQSKWLGIATKGFKWFADKSANLHQQILTYFGTEGAHAEQNPFIRAFSSMTDKVPGKLQTYLTHVDEMKKYVRQNKLEERSGMDFEDLIRANGYYAIARHMPERNEFLLNTRWKQDIEQALKEGDVGKAKSIADMAQALRDNLENASPPEGLNSGGYTNAQARAMMDDFLRVTHLTKEEADTLSDMLMQWNRAISEDRARNGFLSEQTINSFPDEFQYYVPVKSVEENTTGPLNDATIFNPGKYHRIEGSVKEPTSAYDSIMQYARRAAIEFGTQEFGMYAHTVAHMQKVQGRADMGIRSADYDVLMKMRYGRDSSPAERLHAEAIMNDRHGAGIVVEVPEIREDGTYAGRTSRRYIYFDPKYQSEITGITGYDLQQALSGTVKTAASIEPIAAVTSLYGQASTRFTPMFAPVNMMRDIGDRLVHLTARDTTAADGSIIRGSDIATSFLGNLPRAGRVVYDALAGRIDPSSPLGRAWQEYVDQGLYMQYTPGADNKQLTMAQILSGESSRKGVFRKELERRDMKGLADAIGLAGKYKDKVVSAIDKWNDYYNNIAPFSQFLTLREAGATADAAGHTTINTMNLRKHGTLTPFMRMLYPFANPTMQSVTAIARTLGFAPDAKGQFHMNKRGNMVAVASLAAAYALADVMREGLGRDPDSGEYRMDGMPLSDLGRYLPIALDSDGGMFKLPMSYGIMNTALTMAIGATRVERGMMEPADFAFESTMSVLRNISPVDWPAFSFTSDPAAYLTQAFTPALARPLVDLASNKDRFGQPITFASGTDTKSKAAQGRSTTERGYHDLALWIQSNLGIDMAPESYRNLRDSLEVGPLRLIRAFTDSPEFNLRVSDPDNPNARDVLGPWLSVLGASMIYGRASHTNSALFYQQANKIYERIRAENLPMTSKVYNGKGAAAREAYQTKVLEEHGWDQKDIMRYLIVDRTRKQLNKMNEELREKAPGVIIGSESSDEAREMFSEAGRAKAELWGAALRELEEVNWQ